MLNSEVVMITCQRLAADDMKSCGIHVARDHFSGEERRKSRVAMDP